MVSEVPNEEKENASENNNYQIPLKQESRHWGGAEASMECSAEPGRPPATPATRLPLADLIGNVDEAAKRRVPQDVSPEDQLHWVPNSSCSATKTPVSKSRKRAASSSPASSQHDLSVHFSREEQSVSSELIKQTYRTPQADPLAELWNRYAPATSSKEALQALPQPVFHPLMNEASPRSPGVRTSSGKKGLRRWASEGNQLLNSRTKKRKTTAAVYREQIEDTFTDHEIQMKCVAADAPRTSRVGLIVERMQETLLKQPLVSHDSDDPSSSSPLPERGINDNPSQLTSPLRELAPIFEEPINEKIGDSSPSSLLGFRGKTRQKDHRVAQQMSSELNNDGLTHGIPQSEAARNFYIDEFVSSTGAVSRLAMPQVLALPDENEHILKDSFNDLDEDEDLFAIDLGNVASLYDLEPQTIHGRTDTRGSSSMKENGENSITTEKVAEHFNPMEEEHQTILIDDDEDDFGGGEIDDEAFATAEVMVSQSHRVTSTAHPPVSAAFLNTPPPTR